MKQAAKITFAKLKRRTLQSIIYTPEKKIIGTSSILARGKSRVLPTDPLFITFQCIQVTDNDLASWQMKTRGRNSGLNGLPTGSPPFPFLSSRFCLVQSHNACKRKRFQITRDIILSWRDICKFYSVCKYLSCSCYEHEQYTRKFPLSYIQRYLRLPIFCCTFCGIIFERLSKTLQFLSFNLFSTEAQGGQIVISFLFFTFLFLFFTFPFSFFTFQLLF